MLAMTIVGCGKAKRSTPARADELYTGALFRAHVALARRLGGELFVLSALYGLVEGGCIIDPYEQRLADLDALARADWTRRVVEMIEEHVEVGGVITVLAGGEYLCDWPSRIGGRLVIAPFAGRTLGERIGAARAAARSERVELDARVFVGGAA